MDKKYFVPIISSILWVVMISAPIISLINNPLYDWDGTRLIRSLEDEQSLQLTNMTPRIEQTFTARHAGVSEIRIPVEGYRSQNASINITLYTEGAHEALRETSFSLSELKNTEAIKWVFDPLGGNIKTYTMAVEAAESIEAGQLALRMKEADVYKGGELIVPNNAAADLVFDFRYRADSAGAFISLLWDRLQMFKPSFFQGGWLVFFLILWGVCTLAVVCILVDIIVTKGYGGDR